MSRDECRPILSEFRQNLEAFYAALNLAPPYHSVEKTLLCLSALFNAKTAEQQEHILRNPALREPLYLRAFTDSGLHKKHRGIIAGRTRTDDLGTFPDSLRYLLEPFRL